MIKAIDGKNYRGTKNKNDDAESGVKEKAKCQEAKTIRKKTGAKIIAGIYICFIFVSVMTKAKHILWFLF
jgi:hypothetical protein